MFPHHISDCHVAVDNKARINCDLRLVWAVLLKDKVDSAFKRHLVFCQEKAIAGHNLIVFLSTRGREIDAWRGRTSLLYLVCNGIMLYISISYRIMLQRYTKIR
jgi:hypothetical protein